MIILVQPALQAPAIAHELWNSGNHEFMCALVHELIKKVVRT
jgi:hypothetical protein